MNKTLTYAGSVLAVEAAGFVVGMLTREGTQIYADTITKPPLSPPGIVFPIAWTLLYGLMGIGLARVLLSAPSPERTAGITLFAIQLALNLAWSFIFFGARRFDLALIELVAMLAIVIAMTAAFWKADALAGKTQLPYIAWLCFATYLNTGVLMLN